jgi:hypothetical protein
VVIGLSVLKCLGKVRESQDEKAMLEIVVRIN